MSQPTIEAQKVNKPTSGHLSVTFSQTFTDPIILVTPYNENGGGVGSIETITNVGTSTCELTSNNAGEHYYVNVLAIEKGAGELDGTKLISGSKQKDATEMSIYFDPVFTYHHPYVFLSPFWNDGPGPVDRIETVNIDTQSEATAVGFGQDDYFVNYFAMDHGLHANCMQIGRVNKTANGLSRVEFPTPFETEPIVFVSPWFNEGNSSVGNIETVTKVTTDYFEFTGDNHGANYYYINWLAVLPPNAK